MTTQVTVSRVNKHSTEDVRGSYYMCIQLVVYIQPQHTCVLRQYSECWRLFDTEHTLMVSLFFFFCQALKHSGRLIKSIPRAAAPIGSHTEK